MICAKCGGGAWQGDPCTCVKPTPPGSEAHMMKMMNLGSGLVVAYCGAEYYVRKTTAKFVALWEDCTCRKCLSRK